MRILIIAESINIDDSSGSKANVALITSLHKAGFLLRVLHYSRKDIQLSGITCINIQERKFNFLFLLSRIQRKIQHFFKINLAKTLEPIFGFSFTFLNDSKSISQAVKNEKDFDPAMVLTLSKGASFRPHHALLDVPYLHEKWLAYIHDPYPFFYYPEPFKWAEPGYSQKIAFFNRVVEKCKLAGFPSLLLKEWMQNFFPEIKEKSVIIPHQLDPMEFGNKSIPSYPNQDKFVLLHAGNLLRQRPPFKLIEGFSRFLEKRPEAKENSQLLFIGQGEDHILRLKKYQEVIPQLYVSNGYIPYQEVQIFQDLATVNIILESKAEISPFLPGKFPHCIKANRPILLLGPSRSESRRLLGYDYPFHCETDDVQRIAQLIEELYDLWKQDPEILKLNRADLKYYLSSERLKKQLNEIFS